MLVSKISYVVQPFVVIYLTLHAILKLKFRPETFFILGRKVGTLCPVNLVWVDLFDVLTFATFTEISLQKWPTISLGSCRFLCSFIKF